MSSLFLTICNDAGFLWFNFVGGVFDALWSFSGLNFDKLKRKLNIFYFALIHLFHVIELDCVLLDGQHEKLGSISTCICLHIHPLVGQM